MPGRQSHEEECRSQNQGQASCENSKHAARHWKCLRPSLSLTCTHAARNLGEAVPEGDCAARSPVARGRRELLKPALEAARLVKLEGDHELVVLTKGFVLAVAEGHHEVLSGRRWRWGGLRLRRAGGLCKGLLGGCGLRGGLDEGKGGSTRKGSGVIKVRA